MSTGPLTRPLWERNPLLSHSSNLQQDKDEDMWAPQQLEPRSKVNVSAMLAVWLADALLRRWTPRRL